MSYIDEFTAQGKGEKAPGGRDQAARAHSARPHLGRARAAGV